MKKLLLLILLIPVLSWADCFSEQGKTYDLNNKRYYDSHSPEYQKKAHCEAHRCAALNQLTPTCICENLGGVVREPNNQFRCANNEVSTNFDKYFTNENRKHLQEKSQALIPPTPTTTTKVTIEDAKSQCTDIGFKAGTEKFGDCVLELMQ